MGYAKLGEDTTGIHMRLYSRAMIVVDQSGSRICYVNLDLAAATQLVKIMVSKGHRFGWQILFLQNALFHLPVQCSFNASFSTVWVKGCRKVG